MAKALTYEDIAAVLRIDGNGHLVWRVTRGNARCGCRAGRIDRQGYVSLQFAGVGLLAHRVVWLLVCGEWPVGMLDHINGDRSDNRISNLRIATNSQNQANRSLRGFKGVTLHKKTGRFQAQCGKTYLGLYSNPVDAARAYDQEAARRYGQFARLNFGSAS